MQRGRLGNLGARIGCVMEMAFASVLCGLYILFCHVILAFHNRVYVRDSIP
jgi:hypothetical protein